MEKLQETEFTQLNATCEARRCNHNIVKLYDKGTHSDYGCVNCKMQSMNLEDFERIGARHIIREFVMQYGSNNFIDKSTLLHKGFDGDDIQLLVDNQYLSQINGYDSSGAFENEIRYRINHK